MRASLLMSALLPFSAAAASAQQAIPRAVDVLGPTLFEQAGQGMILRTGKEASLLPDHDSASRIAPAIREEAAPILVECLSLIIRDLDQAAKEAEHAKIATVLSSFQSMEGISYFSASEGKTRVLFSVSRRIPLTGGESGAFLPDPPAPAPLGRVDSRVHQKDSRFGGNDYLYSVISLREALLLEGRNEGPLRLGPFTVVKAGGMRFRLLVIPCSDALILYSVTGVSMPPLFRGRLEQSFSNRATALISWFASQYGR